MKSTRGGRSPQPEEMGDVYSVLAEMLKPLNERLEEINQQMSASNKSLAVQQQQIAELTKKSVQFEEKLKETVHDTKKIKKRVGVVEQKQDLQEKMLLNLQMEKANKTLRFQGIEELKGENLRGVMAEFIALAVNTSTEAINGELESVYRVYSNYIKRNNLPGEVVVKFLRRQTRDAVLKAASLNPLKLREIEIRVLKDTPFEVRMKRKAYKGLTTALQANQTQFSWVYPEGIVFKYNGKKERIDSAFKAEEYLKRNFGNADDSKTGEEKAATSEASPDDDSSGAVGGQDLRDPYDLRARGAKQPP